MVNQPLLLPALTSMTELALFAGIGGFPLGLSLTGHFKPALFCENNAYCQKVLKKHWAHVPIIGDIHELSASRIIRDYRINPRDIDIITAGFPCQPFSQAGDQKGTDDPRYLWPQLSRVIGEIRPRYVFLENVPAILTNQDGMVGRGVLRELTSMGYDAEWGIMAAAQVGARHLRKRWFLVGYPHERRHGEPSNQQCIYHLEGNAQNRQCLSQPSSVKPTGEMVHAGGDGLQTEGAGRWPNSGRASETSRGVRPVEPGLGRTIDGFSQGMDGYRWDVATPDEIQKEWEAPRVLADSPQRAHRLQALGNAVFPPLVAVIGQRIWEHHNQVREFVLSDMGLAA